MNFFLSPGFGGLCAVIGAAIAYAAATLATRQKARTDSDQRRQADVDRAWDRFVWVMDHRTEFTPGLIANLLAQTITTAERLNDNNLVDMAGQVAAELLAAGDPTAAIGTSTTPTTTADNEYDDQEGM